MHRWKTKDDEVLDEQQQEKLHPNPPAAAQEGEGAQQEGYPGGRLHYEHCSRQSNIAAVTGSSRTAAVSSQCGRSEDYNEDVQEDSPEIDDLECESGPLSMSSLLH